MPARKGTAHQWFVGARIGGCLPDSRASNTFGNYPINTLFGPQFIQQDLSLAKTFRFTERFGFKLRTDARNAFNHTNLGIAE